MLTLCLACAWQDDAAIREALESQKKGKDPFGFSSGSGTQEPDRIEPGFATQNAKVGPVGKAVGQAVSVLRVPRSGAVNGICFLRTGSAIIWIFLLAMFGLSIAVTTVPR